MARLIARIVCLVMFSPFILFFGGMALFFMTAGTFMDYATSRDSWSECWRRQ